MLFGDIAKRQTVANPDSTIRSVKPYVGTNWKIDLEGKAYTAQEISARTLMKLKHVAKSYLGDSVTDAGMTAPAYFNDA